jgi:hypothetical protein
MVGVFIRCAICGNSQKFSEGAQPFTHDPTCQASSRWEEFPWHELGSILRQLPVEQIVQERKQL